MWVAVLIAVSIHQTATVQHLVQWACRGIFVLFVFWVQLKWQWWYFHLEQKLPPSFLSSISSFFFFFEPGGESRELLGWWDAFYLDAGQRRWPFNSACSLNIKSLAGSPCTSSRWEVDLLPLPNGCLVIHADAASVSVPCDLILFNHVVFNTTIYCSKYHTSPDFGRSAK